MKPSITIIVICSLFFVGACSNHSNKEHTQPSTFCISDSLMKIIQLDTIKVRDVYREVRLTGKISFDEDKVVRVFPPVSGIVQDVTVSLGDYVKPGQVLAKIKSSDMASYNSQYATAIANESIAKRTMEFTEELYKSGAASEKDFRVAKDNYNIASAEVARIKQVLAIFGDGGNDSYLIKSPISGFIVEKKITEGTIIRQDASDNALTISDLKDVWVLGNAFEQDLVGIEMGDSVKVKTLAYDKIYTGIVNKISRTIDPVTKANKVRVVVQNPDFKLQPEMYATVSVRTKEEQRLSSVLSNCTVFNENRYFLVEYKDKCNVSIVPITPHSVVGDLMYLQEKIPDGMKVISKYQLLVYSQLSNTN